MNQNTTLNYSISSNNKNTKSNGNIKIEENKINNLNLDINKINKDNKNKSVNLKDDLLKLKANMSKNHDE